MRTAKRKITAQNFPAFIRLMQDVHHTALGKSLASISEGTGNDIAIKIYLLTDENMSGKTLCKYTEAILNNDGEVINPQLPILHNLAQYVLLSKSITLKKESKNYPYWLDYEAMVSSMPGKKHSEVISRVDFGSEQLQNNNITPDTLGKKPEENEMPYIGTKKQPADKPGKLFIGKAVFNSSSFLKAGIFGGACAGFAGVLLIAALRYFSSDMPFIVTGYESISKAFFFQKIFPILFLFQITGGAFWDGFVAIMR